MKIGVNGHITAFGKVVLRKDENATRPARCHTLTQPDTICQHRSLNQLRDFHLAHMDGFNLYYGLSEARLHEYRRLGLHGMCTSPLKPRQQLESVHYFTSRVRGNPDSASRQLLFVDTLIACGESKSTSVISFHFDLP
ncbi:MAG: hypothetical protein OXI96_09955 [Acidimicrobiaceae bacterium]|nr:hypothetical protein [Acidimicrobiaceae bacterium]